MLGAAIALVCAGLILVGWACWRLGESSWPEALFVAFPVFVLGGILLVVGAFLFLGVTLWMLFGS